MTTEFSQREEEALIQFYEDHPCLWKFSDPKYNCRKDKPIIVQQLVAELDNKYDGKYSLYHFCNIICIIIILKI